MANLAISKLAELWDVPIYAHRLEMPYLAGRSGRARRHLRAAKNLGSAAVLPGRGSRRGLGRRVHAVAGPADLGPLGSAGTLAGAPHRLFPR